MKKRLILLFIIFINVTAYSQNAGDSLLNEMNKASDSKKSIILNSLSKFYRTTDPEKSKSFAEKAFENAVKYNNVLESANALKNIGTYYYFKSHYSEAKEKYQLALKVYRSINYNSGISACLNNIANICKDQSNFKEALTMYFESLKYDQILNDNEGIAVTYSNIGLVYHLQSDYIRAIDYYKKSMDLEIQNKNNEGIGECLINIGKVYEDNESYTEAMNHYKKALSIFNESKNTMRIGLCLNNIGWLLFVSKKYDESKKFILESFNIRKSQDDKEGMATCLANLGKIEEAKGNSDNALEYFFQSILIELDLGNRLGVASSLTSKGIVLLKLGRATESIDFFLNSLEISWQIQAPKEISDNYKYISEAYASLNNFEKAYKFSRLYINLNDSLNMQNIRKVLNDSIGESISIRMLDEKIDTTIWKDETDSFSENGIEYYASVPKALIFSSLIIVVMVLVRLKYRG